ncbi:hypothetical protein GCM10011578_018030 [Streptomyces fuscichromogenes]|uniref:Uncharacterized protein n=1 Tax=Streptomyces fuscichromogenes TaxID=1324013 RepID=A0A917X9L5_9ACTN|nr:hypothetical protein GCM10011578_018030 [Streptomyces fuscichromogenes]
MRGLGQQGGRGGDEPADGLGDGDDQIRDQRDDDGHAGTPVRTGPPGLLGRVTNSCGHHIARPSIASYIRHPFRHVPYGVRRATVRTSDLCTTALTSARYE